LCGSFWKFVFSIQEKLEVNVFPLAKGMLTLVSRYLRQAGMMGSACLQKK
jgi:hypothetical protein